jgi:hypothetical protein
MRVTGLNLQLETRNKKRINYDSIKTIFFTDLYPDCDNVSVVCRAGSQATLPEA